MFWYNDAHGHICSKSTPWHSRRSASLGDVMAHVVVKVGNHTVESLISRASAEELQLRKGDTVDVIIKSTEVMIRKG